MTSALRRVGAWFVALVVLTGASSRLSADTGTTSTPIGGTTISAGIADSQTQLDQAMNVSSGFGTDSLAQFSAAYRASSGGPTLQFLGFNPFEVIASGFNYLYWSLIVLFLGVMAVVATGQALRDRNPGHTILSLVQVYFRLLLGTLLIANIPLIYAVLMTLNGILSQGVQAMVNQSTTIGSTLQTGSLGTLSLGQARMEAIRSAAARRAAGLYPSGASRDEMTQIGSWYNAMANAVNAALSAQNMAGQLPVLDTSTWTNSQTPDDQVAGYVGRTVVQNFSQLAADLSALPTSIGNLSISFPSGGSTQLALLSAALANDDTQAAKALALPNTPASNAQFEAARTLYAKNVQTDTLTYLDGQILPMIGASSTLAQRIKEWFSEKVEQAAAAATGFMSYLRASVDSAGRSIGIALTRMVAFIFTAAVRALLEIDLFILVLAMPFWLLPSTEAAFYGVLRSLISLSVVVPAYQFLMLFVDALMALTLRYVIFGPLATSSGSAAQTAGGTAYMAVTAAIAYVSGGEAVVLVTVCYLVTYIFLAVYMAFKTPKLITVFLRGAGAAGAFVTTFATGLIAGAVTTLLAGAVAGGALGGAGGAASRLLGGGGASGLRPAPSGGGPSPSGSGGVLAAYSTDRSPGPGRTAPPVFGKLVATGLSPPPAPAASAPVAVVPPAASSSTEAPQASRWGEAFGFGIRTFVDSLSAETPGHGFKIAMSNFQTHLQRKEADEEKRHRDMMRASQKGA